MKPDLRKLICEHIIRVLQHQKDVNQKLHICVKHDFVAVDGSAELSCFVPAAELSCFIPAAELSCFVHVAELSCFIPAAELSCSVHVAELSCFSPALALIFELWGRVELFSPTAKLSCF
ncbi:hypothetical protein TNCV_1049431 [Trichonephila clavipes]|nr:hypothetical protein TNCV_1049431 [Trichonephila clavipes]